jgi:hypothetical protein
MAIVYGTDYSAGELSPSELDQFTQYDIRFLIRYIGWPGNSKCISHYPGAYQAHVNAGRMVLLVAEQGTSDPAGGFAGGAAMAQRALADANSIGYPDSLPIFFCADGWLSTNNISVATAMAYLDGAASVMGRARTGAYGFRDFIQAAQAGGHARWLWLCGSAPTDAEVAQGWPHFYQWNNGTINPGGVQADLDWAYPGVMDALAAPAGQAPAPGNGQAPSPGVGQPPPWPLPPGQYFGLITGPTESHGGFVPADRAFVQQIQQALIRKGYVPGVTDPASPWAGGTYTEPTREAVLRFQQAAGRPQTGDVSLADWALLLS